MLRACLSQHFSAHMLARNFAISAAMAAGMSLALLPLVFQCTPVESVPNGFPKSAKFFPIGVWLQSPHNAHEYKTIGINTFVGLRNGPTEGQLANLASQKMYAVTEQNDVGLNSPNRSVIKAWLQEDEPDNAQSNGLGGYGPCVPAYEVTTRNFEIISRDPTRPVMVNFGQGIANPKWIGRGKCFGDMQYYDVAVQGATILSFDIYPVASDDPGLHGKLDFIARGVDNLRARANTNQAIWAMIETTSIKAHNLVTPAQLRSEVWMAIIHGATGIVYFVHEWTGGLREDGIFRHPEIVGEVATINRTIEKLAPVLNSPSLPEKVLVADPALSIMVKAYGDYLYLLAVSTKSVTLTASFAVPIVGDKAVSVIDEDRTLSIVKGRLLDSFGSYGVHIYKIPLKNVH